MMEWQTLLATGRAQATTGNYLRSSFDQDYDRIIFSHPFRRLQDKTQVHPLPEEDFVHTRLTHSLEVSAVGRSLGKITGEVVLQRYPMLAQQYTVFDFGSIVAAAALAHDIGNPPFGHAGEEAISDFFRLHPVGQSLEALVTPDQWHDLIRFEGNAQGFRLLNLNQFGLKVTHATLGAFTKYPNSSSATPRDASRRSQKKFGFFDSEREKFTGIAEQLGLTQVQPGFWLRHPLAFLVEAADDICYSIIDLEDGCSLGLIPAAQAEELLIGTITRSATKLGKLEQLQSRTERIGFLRALAIGDLVEECKTVFLDLETDINQGAFDQALVDVCPSQQALARIIDVSRAQIYRAKAVVEIEAAGHEIIPGLLQSFASAILAHFQGIPTRKDKNLIHLLPAEFRGIVSLPDTQVYPVFRRLIDYISGLTDRNAVGLYRTLKGMSF